MPVKAIVRKVFSNAVGLIAVPYIVEGFTVSQDVKTITAGAIVLSLVDIFIKPVVKFISFPINFITLGFFSWVINAALLYFSTLFVAGISVGDGKLRLDLLDFGFEAVEMHWIATLIVVSFCISFINWILRRILL